MLSRHSSQDSSTLDLGMRANFIIVIILLLLIIITLHRPGGGHVVSDRHETPGGIQ